MTDVWSQRAEAFRESPTHAKAPTSTCSSMVRARPDVKVLDVATGGGHVARRFARRAARSSPSIRLRACSPTSFAPRRTFPFEDGSFDVVTRGSPRTTSQDIRKAVAEMARVAQRLVVIEDNVFDHERVEEAERLRDPTHVRCYTEDEWKDAARPKPASRSSRSSTSTRDLDAGSTGPAAPAPSASERVRAARRPHRRRRLHGPNRSSSRRGRRLDGDHRRQGHAARRAGR